MNNQKTLFDHAGYNLNPYPENNSSCTLYKKEFSQSIEDDRAKWDSLDNKSKRSILKKYLLDLEEMESKNI